MSLLSLQVLLSKPNAIANLQGTSCANTQRIFGILRMNHVNQHDFDPARPGECCSTVSTKLIDINSTKTTGGPDVICVTE